MLRALRTSLMVAAVTTTISTLIGTATAIALARHRFTAKGFYNGFLMMPMMMPDIVLGIGLLIFFVTIGMNLSMLSIMIGHCTFLTSYVFIIIQARIAGLDPALEEASAAHTGATRWVIDSYAEYFQNHHAWAMPVVAETYDGVLNDINTFPRPPVLPK